MTSPQPPVRTFDRAEVESILLEAARLDEARGSERGPAVARVGGDALTLDEIELAGAEVGISRAAVSAAALRQSLRGATIAAPRVHATHEIPGTLSADALERVADDVRTRVPSARVRTTADGLEVEVGKANGEPGSLLVKIRSRGDATTLSVWSSAPALSRGDVATVSWLGIPTLLFPVVATAGGEWPVLAAAIGYAAVGLAAGTGVAMSVNRWRVARWGDRVADVVVPIAASLETLVARRALPVPPDPAPARREG